MRNFVISGFADEIAERFDVQLETLQKLGVKYLELRTADGVNVADFTEGEVGEIKKKLDEKRIKVSALGSPIGKIGIDDEFEPHFESFKNLCKMAKTLDVKNIRMFSFFMPEGKNPEDYREEVLRRLKILIAYAKENDIILLHENEKDIYGDTALRCLDLMKELYCENFKAIFDFANFVQCGQNCEEAYDMLKNYVNYIHIKDAIGMQVVFPGMGEGKLNEILGRLKQDGFTGFLSLEPHMSDFSGFSKLERDDMQMEKGDNALAWNLALNSLKAILYDLEENQV